MTLPLTTSDTFNMARIDARPNAKIVLVVSKYFVLRPQRRGGLLGTGTEGRERKNEGANAHRPGRPRRPWTFFLLFYFFIFEDATLGCCLAKATLSGGGGVGEKRYDYLF